MYQVPCPLTAIRYSGTETTTGWGRSPPEIRKLCTGGPPPFARAGTASVASANAARIESKIGYRNTAASAIGR